MKIAIIDYEGGNLASVAWAVQHLGHQPLVTRDPRELLSSDRVILPGVGAAGAAMAALRKAGLVEVLRGDLPRSGIPCLGICIGIQLLFEHSEEDDVDTLGIFRGRVRRFASGPSAKVPQIGWNQVRFREPAHPLLRGLGPEEYFYFVNSYYPDPQDPALALGTTDYAGVRFASLIRGGSWTASQFHLEKSGRAGLALLDNFLTGA